MSEGDRRGGTAAFDAEAWLEARRVDPADLGWGDFVGSEAAKREIRGLLARLAHRDRLEAVGMAIPKGILIHGAPGTGKTYLARIMAAELLRAVPDLAFHEVNAAELDSVERFEAVVGALRARGAMTVVALDEADAFGLERWGNRQSPTTRAVLLAFLSALDGLRALPNVFWVLTANTEMDDFDPAVVRPGRIEIGIPLPYPTPAERRGLFDYYATRVPCAPGLALDAASELLGRATPAKVRGVMGDAYALALSAGGSCVTDATLVEAIRRDGIAYDAVTSPRALRVRAIHEAGHAIVATVLGVPPTLVVLDRHGGGRTAAEDADEEAAAAPVTWRQIRALIITAYAGLAAEMELHGAEEVTNGSASDLRAAGSLAYEALVGGAAPEHLPVAGCGSGEHGEQLNARMAEEIARELWGPARELVEAHREAIERFADVLVRERHLAAAALRAAIAEALGGPWALRVEERDGVAELVERPEPVAPVRAIAPPQRAGPDESFEEVA